MSDKHIRGGWHISAEWITNQLKMQKKHAKWILISIALVQFIWWSYLMLQLQEADYAFFKQTVFGQGFVHALYSFGDPATFIWFWHLLVTTFTGAAAKGFFWYTLRIWFALPLTIVFLNYFTLYLMKPVFVRGTKVIPIKELINRISNDKVDTGIKLKVGRRLPNPNKLYTVAMAMKAPFYWLKVPRVLEITGGLIVGQTRSGKTSLVFQILDFVVSNAIPAFILDPHCQYMEATYKEERGDVCLCSCDARYTRRYGQEGKGGWSYFNDLRNKDHIKTFLKAVIPLEKGEAKVWARGPRRIALGILWSILNKEEVRPNWLASKIIGEGTWAVKEYCKEFDPELCNTILADPDNDKNGLPGFMMELELAFEPFRDLPDGPFSILDWVQERDGSLIFATNREDKAETNYPIYAAAFALLSAHLMSQESDETRRTFMIMDEIFSLGRLDAVMRLPAEAAKKGVSFWAICQSFVQGYIRYSEDEMAILVDNLASWFFFRGTDDATTGKMSAIIGKAETVAKTRGDSGGEKDAKGGINLNDHKGTDDVVLPSEFTNLQKFEHYMRLSGYSVCRNVLVPCWPPKIAEGMIEAPERPAPEGSQGPYTNHAKRQAKKDAEKEKKEAEKEAEEAKKEAEEAAKKAEAERAKNEAGGDQQPAQESAAAGGLFDPSEFDSFLVNPAAKSFLDNLEDFK